MTDKPKRRGPITLFRHNRRFRWSVIALLVAPFIYVASFGPACWVASHCTTGGDLVVKLYRPIFYLMFRNFPNAPDFVRINIHDRIVRYYSIKYMQLCAKDGWDAYAWPKSLTELEYVWGEKPTD